MNKNISSIIFLFVLIAIDQITKLILSSRDFFPPMADPPLAGFLRIGLVKNFGLPFAVNSSSLVSFVVALIIFVALMVYYFLQREKFRESEHVGFIIIFAGAISNIADRIWLGYVRDLFDLHLGFVFNFADVFIVLGIALVFFSSFKSKNTS